MWKVKVGLICGFLIDKDSGYFFRNLSPTGILILFRSILLLEKSPDYM